MVRYVSDKNTLPSALFEKVEEAEGTGPDLDASTILLTVSYYLTVFGN